MVTADRVVARMAIYSPTVPCTGASKDAPKAAVTSSPTVPGAGDSKEAPKAAADEDLEHSFDITGSYFDNLRVAGHKIEVQLATHRLHKYQKYSQLSSADTRDADLLQPWGDLDPDGVSKLEGLEGEYHALTGFGSRARKWKTNREQRCMGGMFWCSAAGHYNLHAEFSETELHGFGGIICIPKFGVVRLAEVVIHKHRRQLHMLRVDMCSTNNGNIVGGGAGGGGGSMPPP
jgi:hypothetical protein